MTETSGPGRPDDPSAVLQAERTHLQQQVDAVRRSFDAMVAASDSSNADDEHDPEGATIAFERAQLSTQLAAAEAAIAEVDHALQRLAEGAYGRCEVCGQAIGRDRLEARPSATSCITCAAAGRSAPAGHSG